MNGHESLLRTKIALLLCAFLISGFAYGQDNFYQGKTITLLATTAPGGTGDLRVKAVLPFLEKHVPGNPTVVTEYMDGGGGRKGANHTCTDRFAPMG
jgi:tripartite-type tricarboxylate transporter receptor subunit TctC